MREKREMTLFLAFFQECSFSLSCSLLAERYARWGGLFSFCFSFIALASKIQFAFNAYHSLSWWYLQKPCAKNGFVDKLAQKKSFLSFFSCFGRLQHGKIACAISFSFSKSYKYIYVYIYTYTYTYIYIYHMATFSSFFSCLAEI